MVRTTRKLPTEWAKYEPVGNVVSGTRIFAFKTPLKHELMQKFVGAERFTVPDLYRNLLFRGVQLGMVINATNTERYYDPREISALGYEYVKLPACGRGFADSKNLVKRFIRTVDDFLKQNEGNNLMIGVHCTDGVNRSGYLICRYLIDRLCSSSHDALNAVETARGYTIERGALIQAVHRADRERRLRKKQFAESDDDEDLTDKERRRKRRKREGTGVGAIDASASIGLDDAVDLDPQLMQQFDQQFQQLAQTLKQQQQQPQAQSQFGQQFRTSVQQYSSPHAGVQTTMEAYSIQWKSSQQNISEKSSPFVDSPYDDQDEEDDGEPQQIDFSKMGKIDIKEQSHSQKRRERRKNREKQFKVMQRGHFWEINEMQKNGL